MVQSFKKPMGQFIEAITGQSRLAFSHSDQADFFDLVGWAEKGGYPGSVIRFHDFESGEVYEPFGLKHNVMYGRPVYQKDGYYFLQVDYDQRLITLYRYQPAKQPQPVTTLKVDEVDLYNLEIMGNGLNIVSQHNVFSSYYPNAFSFTIDPQETVCFIDEDKVYCEKWIEEGWDEEHDCAGPDYRFYHNVIIRDRQGKPLSEVVGYLHLREDGSWWIA